MTKHVVSGTTELINALNELENKVRNKILRTELRKAAKEVAGAMKAATPVGGNTDPDKGTLKRQTGRVRAGKRKKNQITMLASALSSDPTKFYGQFVDLGTKDQSAQHFVEKSADPVLARLENDIPDNLAREILAACPKK